MAGPYDLPTDRVTGGGDPADDMNAANTAINDLDSRVDATVPKSLVDAKGDLLVGTADNTVGRLPAGTDGQTIVYDSGEATGMRPADLPSGGDAAPSLPTWGITATKQYRLSGVVDGSSNIVPTPDVIGIMFTRQTWRAKVKSFIWQQTTIASSAATIEFGLADGDTGDLVASFGTVDLSSGTGVKQMTLATSVEIPPLAVWAYKLRSASANSGAFRKGLSSDIQNIGNPWDSPTGGARSFLALVHAGTGALPATLPTTQTSAYDFPVFGVTLEAV